MVSGKIIKKNKCENCGSYFVVEASKSKFTINKLCYNCRVVRHINEKIYKNKRL
jgi:hypothetical protein